MRSHQLRIQVTGHQESIVGIEVIHVFRIDQLMLDENGWGNGLPLQDVHRQRQDPVAVSFREVSNRANNLEPGLRNSARASEEAFWPITAQ